MITEWNRIRHAHTLIALLGLFPGDSEPEFSKVVH